MTYPTAAVGTVRAPKTVPARLLGTVPARLSAMSRAALCALLGLCLLAGLTPEASAASAASFVVTRTADDTSPGSLRYAISQAAGTGATITFAIPTTDPGYDSNANADTITLSLGQLNVPGSLTISAPAAPAATVVVSGSTDVVRSRVFSVTGGTVAFSNLTIAHGQSTTGGAGISNSASLTLNGCEINGCEVYQYQSYQDGGGILNTGSLTLNDCRLNSDSTIQGNGGGIANRGTLTVTGGFLNSNATAAGAGGGLFNAGVATLNNCGLYSNTGGYNYSPANSAGYGAGVFNGGSGATLTMTGCTVTGNVADFYGGGIYNSDGTLTVSACVFSSNTAGAFFRPGSGGGIFNAKAGTARITDCLVVSNVGGVGGGMDNAGTLTIINSTFTNNTGGSGATVSDPGAGGLHSGPATLLNDIFYFDFDFTNDGIVSEIAAPPGTSGPTVTYSDVEDGDGNGTDPFPGAGNIDLDPQFVRTPSTFGAGDDGDEHLLITSPAVHAGTNGPGVPPADIEGAPRPAPPVRPSMGAYEVPGSPGGFSAQGGFAVTGFQNVSTGSQVVAQFLPGTTPVGGFTASVSLGDGSVVPGVIVADPATAGVFDVTVSHTYTGTGAYPYGTFSIAVTISGPGGQPSATVADMATIQPLDVTNQVSVNRGGLVYNRATKRYVQTVTIQDIGLRPVGVNPPGTIPLGGPFSLVLDGLTPGAALVTATGTTQLALPAGSPYQTATATGLAPYETLTLVLQFTYAGTARFGYTPRVLAGPAAR